MEQLRVLARLNAETQAHHTDADADLDRYLFRGGLTASDYRTYLARVYGFLQRWRTAEHERASGIRYAV